MMSSLLTHYSRRVLLLLGVGGTAFALDRASKALVLTLSYQQGNLPPSPPLWQVALGEWEAALQLTFNSGVSFGILRRLGENTQLPLLVFGLVISIVVAFACIRASERLSALGASLVVGGALGNLYDRVIYNGVIDFIDLSAYGYHWYRFNVADVAIFCGIALWMLGLLTRKS